MTLLEGMHGTWNVSLKDRWKESEWTSGLSFKSSKLVCMCVWKRDSTLACIVPRAKLGQISERSWKVYL